MKKLKRIIHVLDRTEDAFVFLLCVILFFIGLYALIDSYLVYQHANDTSLLKHKPGYETDDGRDIVGNMVAWLTVKDTNIDHRVMQGSNNEEYLNTDPYGDYSLSGSIFLDYRNQPDFSDSYSLIYGHHMEGNHMFGTLHSFLDEDYFQKHEKGELIVGDTTYDLKIFAVMNTEATEDLIFSPTTYKLKDIMEHIKQQSEHYRKNVGSHISEESRIVALSTCKYPDSVYRVVVFAELTNPHQTKTHDN